MSGEQTGTAREAGAKSPGATRRSSSREERSSVCPAPPRVQHEDNAAEAAAGGGRRGKKGMELASEQARSSTARTDCLRPYTTLSLRQNSSTGILRRREWRVPSPAGSAARAAASFASSSAREGWMHDASAWRRRLRCAMRRCFCARAASASSTLMRAGGRAPSAVSVGVGGSSCASSALSSLLRSSSSSSWSEACGEGGCMIGSVPCSSCGSSSSAASWPAGRPSSCPAAPKSPSSSSSSSMGACASASAAGPSAASSPCPNAGAASGLCAPLASAASASGAPGVGICVHMSARAAGAGASGCAPSFCCCSCSASPSASRAAPAASAAASSSSDATVAAPRGGERAALRERLPPLCCAAGCSAAAGLRGVRARRRPPILPYPPNAAAPSAAAASCSLAKGAVSASAPSALDERRDDEADGLGAADGWPACSTDAPPVRETGVRASAGLRANGAAASSSTSASAPASYTRALASTPVGNPFVAERAVPAMCELAAGVFATAGVGAAVGLSAAAVGGSSYRTSPTPPTPSTSRERTSALMRFESVELKVIGRMLVSRPVPCARRRAARMARWGEREQGRSR